jgi:hypothetical protein
VVLSDVSRFSSKKLKTILENGRVTLTAIALKKICPGDWQPKQSGKPPETEFDVTGLVVLRNLALIPTVVIDY